MYVLLVKPQRLMKFFSEESSPTLEPITPILTFLYIGIFPKIYFTKGFFNPKMYCCSKMLVKESQFLDSVRS